MSAGVVSAGHAWCVVGVVVGKETKKRNHRSRQPRREPRSFGCSSGLADVRVLRGEHRCECATRHRWWLVLHLTVLLGLHLPFRLRDTDVNVVGALHGDVTVFRGCPQDIVV